MAKKKTSQPAPAAKTVKANSNTSAYAWLKQHWPEGFASFKVTSGLVGAWVIFSLLLFVMAQSGGLIYLKAVFAYLWGISDQGQIPMVLDIASVLWCFSIVLTAALIHPALGLAAIVLLRPWLDAFTFPVDNMYFLWGVLVIFVLWGVRVVMRKEQVYYWVPAALLGLFVAWAWATSGSAYNYATAYRALLLWATYFFLFLLAANLCRDVLSRRILIGSAVVVLGLQAGFALLQYFYILPYLRTLIKSSPEVLQRFMGISEMNPELAMRFNVNRAFGTVLFPNALAAFLMLLVPASLAMLKLTWSSIQEQRAVASELASTIPQQVRLRLSVITSIGVWFLSLILCFFVVSLPGAYNIDNLTMIQPADDNVLGSFLLSGGLALIPAGFVFVAGRKHGVRYAFLHLVGAGLVVVPLLACWAFILTYSRGGMLAFAAALVGSGIIYYLGARVVPQNLRKLLAGATIVLLVLTSLFMTPGIDAQAQAQPANKTAPGTELTTEGIDVNLANTGSFTLRWSYWKVGMAMFKANSVFGVGLANFQWAYPQYQYVGAGEVKEAHNGYLQTFCETGIIGGVLLLLFWLYVLLRGIGLVMQHRDTPQAFMVLALFAGVAAFALHSFIDINFSHPGLMFLAMVFAGALLSFSDVKTETPETLRKAGTGTCLVLLVLAALVVGSSVRVYAHEQALSRMSYINITRDKVLKERLSIGQFFIQTLKHQDPKKPQAMRVLQCMTFFDSVEELAKVGTFYEQTPSGVRKLGPGDQPGEATVVVFPSPHQAKMAAIPHFIDWLRELEHIDNRFPHDAELAHHIGEWYGMVADGMPPARQADKEQYALQNLVWAQRAVERNPFQADLYVSLGNAHWRQGALADPKNREGHFKKAIAALETAPKYAPTIPAYLDFLTGTYRRLAGSYAKGGHTKQQNTYNQKAEEVAAKSQALKAQRRGA